METKRMNLLFTGASGQLGQNLSPQMAPLFSNVYELSRHNMSSFDAFRLIKADLALDDIEMKLDETLHSHNIDLLLHMAAVVTQESDIDSWNRNLITNIIGTHRLLNWAINRKVGAFYFISGYLHLDADTQPFTIRSSFCPNIPYAAAKLVNEIEIANLCKKANIPYGIFRLPSFYGPKPTKVWSVLPAMIRSALSRGSINVYGKGSRTMNFVHTSDITSAIVKAFAKKATGVFHIAAKRSVSMLELAKIIATHLPQIEIVRDRIPDPQEGKRFEIDITETAKVLEWEPLIDISQGVSDAILSVEGALSAEQFVFEQCM